MKPPFNRRTHFIAKLLCSSFAALLVVMLTPASLAATTTRYAALGELTRAQDGAWTLTARSVALVTPAQAVARGVIPAPRARQYRAVFSEPSQKVERLRVASGARVRLLTYPSLKPKATTLETAALMLAGSDALPPEFEDAAFYRLTVSDFTVTAIEALNERALTGVYQQAVKLSRQTTFAPLRLVLDFVALLTTDRQMRRVGQRMEDNPGGLYISNTNPLLRTFPFAKDGTLALLNGVTPVPLNSPQQLQAALNGQNPYGLSWDAYFQARISDLTGEVFELKQGYVP